MSHSHSITNTEANGKVAIVGAGSIGAAFAVVYASAGREVALFDTQATSLERAKDYIQSSLRELHNSGLLQENVDAIFPRVTFCDDLAGAVNKAVWVHECAPERVELKIDIFRELDHLCPRETILASASSAIGASHFTANLPGKDRCIVAHPGNPPFLLRVLELVPSPDTADETLARAQAFSESVGLHPITVMREVEGFVFNRLQGALLREAYCLVRDGVASVEDIDALVSKGLGLRWSVIGPFETVDLNTRGGIEAHARKLGPAYARMGQERGQDDPWTEDLVANVSAQRRETLPLEQWPDRVAWRDRMLMRRLAAAGDDA